MIEKGSEVKVNADGKFNGAEGEVLEVFEGPRNKTWAMTFLHMPYDRKKEFKTTNLKEI